MVKITVNGRVVDADPTKPLIKACHDNDVDVPMYCYHPGLSPVGSCRICQVEVKQGEAPGRVVVACRTQPAEGMVVDTESPKAHATRRECLEFLLKNHPLDCPICDKAGECDLQDFTYEEGQAQGRSHEPRRPLEKRKSLGEVIVLDEERCILCSRCVRFFEEVPKKAQLTVSDLGSRSVISTFMDRPLSGNYQGNIADLCPVGALTLKKFRFQARVWNLVKMASTCVECSRGCSIQVETLRGSDVKRFRPRPNEQVNGWWMCDHGRFAFDHANAAGRLEGARMLEGTQLVQTPIEEALCAVRDALMGSKGGLVVLSPFCTVEEGRALRELAQRHQAEIAYVSPPPSALKDELLHTGDPCPNRRGLEELGIRGEAGETLTARLAAAKVGLIAGERVVELLGPERVRELPGTLALFAFECHPVASRALRAEVGIANHVERTGTVVNVDGIRGPLAAAKPAPRGVRALERHLQDLARLSPRRETAVR
ncbi:MAG: (2Fe-2S)-binding protein [Planctomycetes bacterium]|nr:(2Fe-2S)-binding protein [Planctomycetota bacterium]